jgi:putative salt-induced outer membrane protein
MLNKFYKATLLSGLCCLPFIANSVQAEVTPDQFNLMMTAANKDSGANFNTLIDLLIATYPDNEAEIREVAAQIRPVDKAPAETASNAAQATTPSPAEGTIFSDEGASQFSQIFLPGWEKEVGVNALYSTGNTVQKSFGFETKFTRDYERFHQTATTYFDFNTSNGVTNKRRYGLGYKSDYDLSEISYITGFAGFEGDSFGAFNKRFTLTGGYGLRVFDNDTYQWSVEAGTAILITKPASTGEYDTKITAFAGSIFAWTINDRSEFDNATKVYVGNVFVLENKSAIKVKASEALSGKLSFDIIYNRDVPLGRKKTDTITRLGVQYDF